MDYQEAKRLLHPETTRDAIWEIADKQEALNKINEACLIACEAIDELQALHNQGFSLERLKDIDFRKEIVEHINYDAYVSLQDELEEYREIGTLDEVREAVEKQKAKKPIEDRDHGIRYTEVYRCPSCNGSFLGKGFVKYCFHCGKKIDWSDEE